MWLYTGVRRPSGQPHRLNREVGWVSRQEDGCNPDLCDMHSILIHTTAPLPPPHTTGAVCIQAGHTEYVALDTGCGTRHPTNHYATSPPPTPLSPLTHRSYKGHGTGHQPSCTVHPALMAHRRRCPPPPPSHTYLAFTASPELTAEFTPTLPMEVRQKIPQWTLGALPGTQPASHVACIPLLVFIVPISGYENAAVGHGTTRSSMLQEICDRLDVLSTSYLHVAQCI